MQQQNPNNNKSGYGAYMAQATKSMSPYMLIFKALQQGIRFAKEQRKAIEENDIEKRFNSSEKLFDLVLILKSTIDKDHPELNKFMNTMWESFDYISILTTRIELKNDLEANIILINYLEKLADNWRMLDKKMSE